MTTDVEDALFAGVCLITNLKHDAASVDDAHL
jgi:hypothetical protein